MAEERRKKHPSDSYTEQVHIITQSDINGFNRLFGGTLMSWIDVLAAVVARRHSECNVTTVFVDTLEFRAPARVNDTIMMTGKMTYAGKTSMEVCRNFPANASSSTSPISFSWRSTRTTNRRKCLRCCLSRNPNWKSGKPARNAASCESSAVPKNTDRLRRTERRDGSAEGNN